VIEYAILLHGLAQQWTPQKKWIWHKGRRMMPELQIRT